MDRVGMLGFFDDRHFAGDDGANYEADGHARGVPAGSMTIGGAR